MSPVNIPNTVENKVVCERTSLYKQSHWFGSITEDKMAFEEPRMCEQMVEALRHNPPSSVGVSN